MKRLLGECAEWIPGPLEWGIAFGALAWLLLMFAPGCDGVLTPAHSQEATDKQPATEVEWVAYLAGQRPFAIEAGALRCRPHKRRVYIAPTEVRLPNGRRVDIVWNDYAIEVDWSHKFFEGYGQAVYYARWLRKQPALLLLIKEDAKHHLDAARFLCGDEVELWIYDTRHGKWLIKPEPYRGND